MVIDDGDDNVCIVVNVIISRHAACVLFNDDEHERLSDECELFHGRAAGRILRIYGN
jgi:hypothetical protein